MSSLTLRFRNRNRIKQSVGDRVFLGFCYGIVIILLCITAFPLINVVSSSISAPSEVGSGRVLLLPRQIDFSGYSIIFKNAEIWTGYANTIFYTIVGTMITFIVTIPASFALSIKGLIGKKVFIVIMMITWYFGGGLIPTYLIIKNLGLYNTRFLILILGSFASGNVIVCKTFFEGIPSDLREAAEIDGCGLLRYFVTIALPISQALLGVMLLYFVVGRWNEYFNSMMYLSDRSKFPLQLILREILIENQAAAPVENAMAAEAALEKMQNAERMKYGVIIVSSLPVLIMFPFLQKYFDKGIMIGSLKG